MHLSPANETWLTWLAIWDKELASSGMEQVQVRPGSAIGILFSYDDARHPYRIRYELYWNDRWEPTSLEAQITGPTYAHALQIQRSASGHWALDGESLEIATDILDLDIWPTPLTNTLAIRRLNLEVGQSHELKVLFIQGPTLELTVREQIYTRLSETIYRFQSPAENFAAELKVDADGFVVEYPELFRLVSKT